MPDVLSRVAALRRPVLLVQAARFGLEDYRRAAHLPRLLGPGVPGGPVPGAVAALVLLLELEAALDARRLARAADYRIARHVAILIALTAEARSVRAPAAVVIAPAAVPLSGPDPADPPAQTKASGIDSFLRAI